MQICYFCGNNFDQLTTIDHGEHVIQQAIGGSLISKGILCKNCGEELGNDIDVPFNKIFEGIVTRLDIKNDRKANNKPSTTGIIVSEIDSFGFNLKGTPVFWNNYKVSPIKPFYKLTEDKKKVIVYSSQKQYKSYKHLVNKEIMAMHLVPPPKIILCDDIDAFIQFDFNMDNKAFKRGIAKIAIGFACSQGIHRSNLPLALKISDSNKGVIDDKIVLLKYAPLSVIDTIIEKEKRDLANYPSHTIILFNSEQYPSDLWCYVELFSTFQFYILLNDNYNGNDKRKKIYAYHYQRIEKADEYQFAPDRNYYKKRKIFLYDLGITEERIERTFKKQKKQTKSLHEIEIDLINEEIEKQKNIVNFEYDIQNALAYSYKKFEENNNGSVEILEVYENYLLFFEKNSLDSSYEKFNISPYRRFFKKDKKIIEYPYELNDMHKINSEELNKHTFYRFNELSEYSQIKGIKEMIKQVENDSDA